VQASGVHQGNEENEELCPAPDQASGRAHGLTGGWELDILPP
jgi:hypothetical protein